MSRIEHYALLALIGQCVGQWVLYFRLRREIGEIHAKEDRLWQYVFGGTKKVLR